MTLVWSVSGLRAADNDLRGRSGEYYMVGINAKLYNAEIKLYTPRMTNSVCG